MSSLAPVRARPPLLLAAALTLSACKPSLMQEPRDFTGDDQAKVGVLCSMERVAADEKDYWVKFLVVHAPGWQADWQGGTIQVHNGTVRRRAAGNPAQGADGTWRRFETYWVTPAAGLAPGARISVGPLRYTLQRGAETRLLQSASCVATLK